MAGALNGILEFLGAAVALIINLVGGTLQLLEMLPHALAMLTYSLAMIPTPLFAFFYASITVAVVYLIIGRS